MIPQVPKKTVEETVQLWRHGREVLANPEFEPRSLGLCFRAYQLIFELVEKESELERCVPNADDRELIKTQAQTFYDYMNRYASWK